MHTTTAYVIREGSEDDARALHRLLTLNLHRRPSGAALGKDASGDVIAAVVLEDGYVLADQPGRTPSALRAMLRTRFHCVAEAR
jgi:hypothetical protein